MYSRGKVIRATVYVLQHRFTSLAAPSAQQDNQSVSTYTASLGIHIFWTPK
jgi:hypothetical protein